MNVEGTWKVKREAGLLPPLPARTGVRRAYSPRA